jgi:hypothetical protein
MGNYTHSISSLPADSVATSDIQNNAVDNTKASDMGANAIKANPTASTADPQDVAIAANSILLRQSANLTALAMAASTILARLASGDIVAATPAELRTLLNVANGATANSSDATLLDRANHTGTQTAATISDFTTAVQALSINGLSEDTNPTMSGVLSTNGYQVKFSQGATVASATTLTLGTDGNTFPISGTTTITGINTVGVGSWIKLRFTTALQLTHSGSFLLPGSANITTASGDIATFYEFSTGSWRCDDYSRANGTPIALGANTVTNTVANDMAANTVKANNTASTADPSDVAMATNTVLLRAGSNIEALAMGASTILARLATGDIVAATTTQLRTLLGLSTADTPTFTGVDITGGFTNIATASSELTIASDAVTATRSIHSVDTEADAATDDVSTIAGFSHGRLLILRGENLNRNVILKDGVDNLNLDGNMHLCAGSTTNNRIFLVGTGSGWNELGRTIVGNSFMNRFKKYEHEADHFQNPNNANWAVNATAPASADTNNNGFIGRCFDDTAEEGIGFSVFIPEDANNIMLHFISRAEVGAAANVVPKLYVRQVPDNASVTAWSAGTNLTALAMTADEAFQYDTQTIALTTLSLTAGRYTQFQLTRVGTNGSDTLTGDWCLLFFRVSFS